MKRITLSIVVVFILQTAFCQEKYLPGYIVRLPGDTLHGYIDYRNWDRNPDKIFFKENLTDNKSRYGPMEIKGFGVLDEIYESAIIESEVSNVNTRDLEYNSELVIRIDTTFLQTMIKGVKSLYFYKNKFGHEQFYIRQDSSYQLLIYKKYLKEKEGQTVIAENRKFIGQLTLYFSDCPVIQQKLADAGYQKNSLENLFIQYYKCIHTEIAFQKKTEKISTEFGILAGLSITTLEFISISDDFPYLTKADYPPSVFFSAGLFLDVALSRNRGKLSICNELIFTSFKVSGRYEDYIHENRYTITYTTLGLSYIKMNNMLRFKYPIGKFFIFINGGITTGIIVFEKNYKKQEFYFYSTERIEEGKALNDMRRFEVGFIAGLGAKFRRFSFETRYERGNGFSEYLLLKSSTNRFYLLFGYRF